MVNFLYFIAIICPPLAAILCRKYVAALFCALGLIAFWIPGIILAVLVVRDYKQEQFLKKLKA